MVLLKSYVVCSIKLNNFNFECIPNQLFDCQKKNILKRIQRPYTLTPQTHIIEGLKKILVNKYENLSVRRRFRVAGLPLLTSYGSQ